MDNGQVQYGKGVKLRDGKDFAVLSLGSIGNAMSEAIEASGRDIAHYDMRWLKPMDEEILHDCGAYKLGKDLVNGTPIRQDFLKKALEWMADHGYTPRIVRLGVKDQFVEHGSTKELYHLLKLDKEGLCESLLQVPVK